MITIDYCGYQIHNADCDTIYRPSGTASNLFLLILSPMTFYFADQSKVKVQPGACIVYPAGVLHHYQAEKEFFNSYVHFFCEDTLFDKYELQTNEIFYPKQANEINALIKKLHQESLNHLMKSEEMMDLLMQQLLILLHRSGKQSALVEDNQKNYYPELLALRETMLEQCEKPWTIDHLCKQINIGKSQFYRYYECYFHQPPKEELLKARLQKARYLISNEALTIKQAAYSSGFENVCHFNRLFKKQFGCTPTEYKGRNESSLRIKKSLTGNTEHISKKDGNANE